MAREKIVLNQKQIESIERLAGFGLSVEHIAHALGISKKTLERRVKDSGGELNPKDAMNRGRANAIATVAETAFDLASSGKCPGMTIFYLKCRAKWKEDSPTEPDEDDQGVTVYETQFGSTPLIAPKKTDS